MCNCYIRILLSLLLSMNRVRLQHPRQCSLKEEQFLLYCVYTFAMHLLHGIYVTLDQDQIYCVSNFHACLARVGASYPGPSHARGPGTHCMRMRVIALVACLCVASVLVPPSIQTMSEPVPLLNKLLQPKWDNHKFHQLIVLQPQCTKAESDKSWPKANHVTIIGNWRPCNTTLWVSQMNGVLWQYNLSATHAVTE